MQSSILPSPDRTLKTAYLKLVKDIDILAESIINNRFSQTLQCRAGCTECCMSFSVLPLEAAFIGKRLKEKQPTQKQEGTGCMLLSGDLCSIYDIRPIICRTQGLPIAYIDDNSGCIEVSACLLNFSDDFEFDQEDLFFMDQFNSRLAELNLQYCIAAGLDPKKRIALADLYVQQT